MIMSDKPVVIDLETFDFAAECDRGAVLELLHKDGKPLVGYSGERSTITLRGNESAVVENRRRELAREYSGKAGDDVDREHVVFEVIVAATKGIANIPFGGKDMEFSEENVRALYKRQPFITNQVKAFIAEDANFLGKAPRG